MAKDTQNYNDSKGNPIHEGFYINNGLIKKVYFVSKSEDGNWQLEDVDGNINPDPLVPGNNCELFMLRKTRSIVDCELSPFDPIINIFVYERRLAFYKKHQQNNSRAPETTLRDRDNNSKIDLREEQVTREGENDYQLSLYE